MTWRFALAALALVPTPALADVIPADFACIDKTTDPAKFELARGIVNASVPDSQQEKMFDDMLDSLIGMLRSNRDPALVDPEMDAIVDRQLKSIPSRLVPLLNRHMPQMYGAIACAYAREFSLAELKDINAFALSPSGRRFLTHSSVLMADPDVQKAFQAYMQDVQKLTREMTDEMMAELAELRAKRAKKSKN